MSSTVSFAETEGLGVGLSKGVVAIADHGRCRGGTPPYYTMGVIVKSQNVPENSSMLDRGRLAWGCHSEDGILEM
jgi:hypothetical protein